MSDEPRPSGCKNFKAFPTSGESESAITESSIPLTMIRKPLTLSESDIAAKFMNNSLEIMKGIKKVFDPNGILNPGKMFV
ncbi:MAG TPA: FAD-linked oxidase C-terminal domain-containing protein [Pyrinomonadaceae bacterium]|nr:FAD-linked oxidase C-terminal domain-containing protein [Pyrinomonadaceae bacterium]